MTQLDRLTDETMLVGEKLTLLSHKLLYAYLCRFQLQDLSSLSVVRVGFCRSSSQVVNSQHASLNDARYYQNGTLSVISNDNSFLSLRNDKFVTTRHLNIILERLSTHDPPFCAHVNGGLLSGATSKLLPPIITCTLTLSVSVSRTSRRGHTRRDVGVGVQMPVPGIVGPVDSVAITS